MTAAPARRPNILMVLTDDHAAHAVGAYGSVVNVTPHLDEIASRGWVMEDCFCTNSLCTPSRASILTGTHSHINGVTTLSTPMDPSLPTFVSRLQEEGYRTGIVGKWHLGEGPEHEPASGEVFLRVGDESKKLSYSQRRELDYDRGSAQFEYEPAVDATIEDLDNDELTEYRESIGATSDDLIALRARSLVRRDGTLTLASVLLLGQHPQDWLPQAHVRVTRFSANTAGTGRRQTVESGIDTRLEGPIARIVDEAAALIDSWMPHRRALDTNGRFTDQSLVPKDAWLEGLVNAVVHRSYSMAGDHIRVNIFPSRVEIESPGRFPGLADPTRPLDIARYARNPRIARVCSDLGITQERGEGIRRMFDEMRLVGLVDPEYHQTSGSVRLTLTALSRLSPEQQAALPRGAEEILAVLRHREHPLGTGELVEATGRSRPWVRAQLEELRASGVVRWEGKSPRDPRATWSLPR